MDAKTLSKMTVLKLREEAIKFDDLTGVHGMNKAQLVKVLKEKYGIVEEHHEPEDLEMKRHAVKAKIKKLKHEKENAREAKDAQKLLLLRKRLRQHRRLLKKIVKLEAKANAA